MQSFKTILSAALLVNPAIAFAGGFVVPVADEPVTVAVEAPSGDWSGFYLGAQIGTGGVDYTSTAGGPVLMSDDFNTYGLHAGYMHDLGRAVIGGELDYDMANLDSDDRDVSLFRLKARVGYNAGNFLPYFTAGLARLKGDKDDAPRLSDTGSFYGIGAAYKISERFTVGGEYLKHDFDDFDDSGFDLDVDSFTLRASYNF